MININSIIMNVLRNGLILSIIDGFTRQLEKKININIKKRLNEFGSGRMSVSTKIVGHQCISIGENFSSGACFRLEAIEKFNGKNYSPKIVIKDNVEINEYVHIAAVNYVEIGNHVLMASKIYISDHNHGNYSGECQSSPDVPPIMREINSNMSVIIGDNVWIGEFVSILQGVSVGKGSIIGSNSVVNKDVPEYSIVVGAPARVIKRYDFQDCCWK